MFLFVLSLLFISYIYIYRERERERKRYRNTITMKYLVTTDNILETSLSCEYKKEQFVLCICVIAPLVYIRIRGVTGGNRNCLHRQMIHPRLVYWSIILVSTIKFMTQTIFYHFPFFSKYSVLLYQISWPMLLITSIRCSLDYLFPMRCWHMGITTLVPQLEMLFGIILNIKVMIVKIIVMFTKIS